MSKNYNEDSIQTLEPLEHIRKRPGMYIGALGDGSDSGDGIYTLFKEVVDNSIDEFTEGFGNVITIEMDEKTVCVTDRGRGIPQGKLVECVSIPHAGGKFNNNTYATSSGLNGVGIKAVNALSSSFQATSIRDGKQVSVIFEKGEQKKKSTKPASKDSTNGTQIIYTPDDSENLFVNYKYNLNIITAIIKDYVQLNQGLTIILNGKSYKSRSGLKDLLSDKIGDTEPVYDIIHYKSKDNKLEFALTHIPGVYSEDFFSYANGKYTMDGGKHQTYFKEAVAKAINDFFKKSWSPQDIRSGMVGAVSVRVANPLFDSQTKTRLTNEEVRQPIMETVREQLTAALLKNPKLAKALCEKITSTEKTNKQITEVKKNAKEAQSRTRFNIPKLRDSKFHKGGRSAKAVEEGNRTMIFICEGDSAAGTITQARDVNHQAVFPVRGKVLNVCGKDKSVIYKKDKDGSPELFNIMTCLGIEDSIDNLRYEKVIIATDADDDGYHIRMLLMTFFFTFFEELVTTGHLYILETPLFRVRNKQETRYCYSEAEKDTALAELKGSEITRFKGLGEINPKEFKPFIGSMMKLTRVSVPSLAQIKKEVEFYMGSNTPERTQFVMENIINV